MTAPRTAVVAVVLVVAAAVPADTEPAAEPSAWIDAPSSRVRLVASRAKTAGGSYLAGLEMVMADGWKTYWRTPGDAGVPPQFDWSGSTNTAAVKVLYPAPMRMREAGGEVIGYKNAVLFPLEVTPEHAAKPVALKLALEFGICKDICIPATATLELSLPPIKAGGRPDPIKAALERVPRQPPRKTDPELRRVALGGGEAAPRLTVEAAFRNGKGADVFIEAPEGLYVPLPRKVAEEPGGIVRYEAELSPDLVRDLSGKTLIFTLVSEAGSSETRWTCC